MERYSPDQYGRMMPDPQGDWLLFPHVQQMMLEALMKNDEAHATSLADAQRALDAEREKVSI